MIVVSRPIHTVQCYTKQKETGSLLQCSHINFLTVTQQKHSVFSLKLLLLKSPSSLQMGLKIKRGLKIFD